MDPYNHDQLADNWSKLDLHDHTPGRGVQIPTEGIADGAITSAKLGTIAISSSQITDGTITDTDLASPNNAAYRTVFSSAGIVAAGVTAGTYYFANQAAIASAGATTGVPNIVPITSTDFSVANKTANMRIRAGWTTNAVAPTSTFTLGLYPITAVAGAAGNTNVTLGTVLAGSTAALVAPAASSKNQIASTDFAVPTSDVYVLGVTTSVATTAASSYTTFQILLQVHWT